MKSPLGVLCFPNTLLYNHNVAQRPKHSKADVEKALKDAEDANWTVDFPFGHWGQIWCPAHICRLSIWSTPKNEGNHAKQIRRAVEHCPHQKPGEEN